jgi:hypothetical protein
MIDIDITSSQSAKTEHRFLGFYRCIVEGVAYYIYRCVCGYTEGVPLHGGPGRPLDRQFRLRPDARNVAKHRDLERAHEAN